MLILTYCFGQGKLKMGQEKVREMSGNFKICCEWQPCFCETVFPHFPPFSLCGENRFPRQGILFPHW